MEGFYHSQAFRALSIGSGDNQSLHTPSRPTPAPLEALSASKRAVRTPPVPLSESRPVNCDRLLQGPLYVGSVASPMRTSPAVASDASTPKPPCRDTVWREDMPWTEARERAGASRYSGFKLITKSWTPQPVPRPKMLRFKPPATPPPLEKPPVRFGPIFDGPPPKPVRMSPAGAAECMPEPARELDIDDPLEEEDLL
eukprot:TRINITY_DN76782_c0_g1_i1.p1 TRINITY_DN76782_c0_g1~~TRINITY_DN76782_c0_g1_i1.p1  ORF type:complete len:219 (+),score=36.73 TRINITY_DN76782_c0_g1_i1:65-658(+)